ncbi:MAG TPA: hypothetical protein DEF36_00285 [Desulfotomaculum sp.]|nr:hypothetical protein [Desulfotomaculum sp.]
MFCTKCGKRLPEQNNFCTQCGNIIRPPIEHSYTERKSSEEPDIPQAQTASEAHELSNGITEEDFRRFIGNKADYYISKWKKANTSSPKVFFPSWNWAAFLITCIWAAYRKMYAYAALFLVLTVILYLITDIALLPLGALVINIVAGITGNYLYFLHCSSKISSAKKTGNNNYTSAGGTNWQAIVVSVLACILVGTSYSFAYNALTEKPTQTLNINSPDNQQIKSQESIVTPEDPAEKPSAIPGTGDQAQPGKAVTAETVTPSNPAMQTNAKADETKNITSNNTSTSPKTAWDTITYDGYKYEGEWLDYPDGHCVFHGKGTLTYPSGDKYVGEFRNGNIEGFGTYYFAEGQKYVGQFKNDCFDGKGKIVNADGTIAEEGTYRQN